MRLQMNTLCISCVDRAVTRKWDVEQVNQGWFYLLVLCLRSIVITTIPCLGTLPYCSHSVCTYLSASSPTTTSCGGTRSREANKKLIYKRLCCDLTRTHWANYKIAGYGGMGVAYDYHGIHLEYSSILLPPPYKVLQMVARCDHLRLVRSL